MDTTTGSTAPVARPTSTWPEALPAPVRVAMRRNPAWRPGSDEMLMVTATAAAAARRTAPARDQRRDHPRERRSGRRAGAGESDSATAAWTDGATRPAG